MLQEAGQYVKGISCEGGHPVLVLFCQFVPLLHLDTCPVPQNISYNFTQADQRVPTHDVGV